MTELVKYKYKSAKELLNDVDATKSNLEKARESAFCTEFTYLGPNQCSYIYEFQDKTELEITIKFTDSGYTTSYKLL